MGSKKQFQVLWEKKNMCKFFMQKRIQEMEAANSSKYHGWCRPAWDNVMCWDAAPPDTVVTQPCPLYVVMFNGRERAYRECLTGGIWKGNEEKGLATWTNFTMCASNSTHRPPDDINYHIKAGQNLLMMYTIGYSLSLITLLIAVIIMACCRRLHRKSNTLHINLFMAFILRASLLFIKDRLFVSSLGLPKDLTQDAYGNYYFIHDGSKYLKHQRDLFHNFIDYKKAFGRVWHDGLWQVTWNYNIDSNITEVIKALYDYSKSAVLLNNQIGEYFRTTYWECRLIMVSLIFSVSATHMWILMEGVYLYMLINWTILTERNGVRPYILLGWITPWLIVIPWVIVKYLNKDAHCWTFSTNDKSFWILNGSWIATVVINFLLFLNICRVLFMRVRSNHRHDGSSKYRRFAKFVLVLIPLFGIMYIVFLVAFPHEQNVTSNDKAPNYNEGNVVYLYIEMGYNSFQGCVLALLFCFLNEDVHSEMRRLWQRHWSRRENSKYLNRTLNTHTFHQTPRDTPLLSLRTGGGAVGGRAGGEGDDETSPTPAATTCETATSTAPTTANAAPQSRPLAEDAGGDGPGTNEGDTTTQQQQRQQRLSQGQPVATGATVKTKTRGRHSGGDRSDLGGVGFASNGSGSSDGDSAADGGDCTPSTKSRAGDVSEENVVPCAGDDGGDGAGGVGAGGVDRDCDAGEVVWVGRGRGNKTGAGGGVPAKVLVLSKARGNGINIRHHSQHEEMPSTINHHQETACSINQHQEMPSTINHHQETATTINHHQETATTINQPCGKNALASSPTFSEERQVDDLAESLTSA